MDLWWWQDLVTVPKLSFKCGAGEGVAVCESLNLVATSTIAPCRVALWTLPLCVEDGFQRVHTFHDDALTSPFQFNRLACPLAGQLVFTSTTFGRVPQLLVVDNDNVHVLDVVTRCQVGSLDTEPGVLKNCRGIAVSPVTPLVAVIANGGVIIFRALSEDGRSWTVQDRIWGSGHCRPLAIRFGPDGTQIHVCNDDYTSRQWLSKVLLDGRDAGTRTRTFLPVQVPMTTVHDMEPLENGGTLITHDGVSYVDGGSSFAVTPLVVDGGPSHDFIAKDGVRTGYTALARIPGLAGLSTRVCGRVCGPGSICHVEHVPYSGGVDDGRGSCTSVKG
jgi:hypothetical protein